MPKLVAEPNWEEMEKTLERFGNAMSQIRWAGGNATLVWDKESGDRLFTTVVGDETKEPLVPAQPENEDLEDLLSGLRSGNGKPQSRPIPNFVEEIAHLVEAQPLMSDLTPLMGDMQYHKALADKIRKKFVSTDFLLARTRLEADTYAIMLNQLLDAMCEERGISTASPYEPGKRAPNFILSQRLGIGRVFDLPNRDKKEEVSK